MESASPSVESIRRPLLLALAAALGTATVWAVLSAVIGLHVGLLVVAAFGGWLIGSALRPVGVRGRWLAVAIALGAWLVGSMLDFVISQVFLPSANTPLAQRLTPAGYLDYAAGTFDIIQLAAIAILVIVAWRSAR